jgi:hypothetical protein
MQGTTLIHLIIHSATVYAALCWYCAGPDNTMVTERIASFFQELLGQYCRQSKSQTVTMTCARMGHGGCQGACIRSWGQGQLPKEGI